MTRTRLILLAVLLAGFWYATCALPQAHDHRGAAPPPRSLEVPDSGVTVPMHDIGGRPLVDVMVDGKGPYTFILDTGAVICVVDSALRAELSIPDAPGVHAAPVSGGQSPDILMVPEFRVGAASARGVMAAAMRLSLFPGPDAPRGVLNASMFPGYLVTFDYPRRTISIRRGELPPPDSLQTFEYGADEALPTLPITVAGQRTRIHLDTGSGYGLILPNHWLDELPLATKPFAAGHIRTPHGDSDVQRAELKGTIAIGRFPLDSTSVLFSDVRSGAATPTGNVGYNVLKAFAVTLDSKNRRIRFSRGG
jgi:aspartyl protease